MDLETKFRGEKSQIKMANLYLDSITNVAPWNFISSNLELTVIFIVT